jgi:ABC-type branched-subunit amino acid transport system ATPase component
MLGGGVSPAHPRIFGITLDTGRSYYGVALATLVLTMLVARNVRRGGFGRILTSVRDNEDNARAFTVRAARVKAQAFLLAGFLAGIGGALYTHELTHIDPVSFPTATSIDLVVMTVIGGLGIVAGPLLGALFVLALPAFVPLDAAGLAATRLGQLLIILYLPGGIAQVVEPVRDRAAAFLARRSGRIVSEWEDEPLPAPTVRVRDLGVEAPAPTAGVMLDARGLRKSYGGLVAVSDVSLQVMSGETLGLIGPNGAGKTTTFELLSGFVPADAGTVVFDGDDVTTYGPEARAQLGLVRSFQDSGLFPTLTVLESVAVALERVAPTRVLSSIAFPSASERAKQAGARDIVSLMGLDGYRDLQIQELSTGTRRIAEMACLVATRPKLLLFDEPSTGIAQRETEALGDVIQEIKRALGVTLVVIEHDMPLITGIADRIVAMADGRVIASGSPRDVQRDPLVVEAYLGGSLEAIQRSGAATASPNGARSRRRVRRSDQAKA